jgi:hypothetical protein
MPPPPNTPQFDAPGEREALASPAEVEADMSDIPGSLALPRAILVLVGALLIIVGMTAELKVGETAAMGRLKRWARLPEAILRLSPRGGRQGITLGLAD